MSEPRSPQVDELSEGDLALMERLFSNPRLWPDTAKVWIADYVSQNGLLPISQVQGFTQFTANQNVILTNESTTSTSYTNLATVGPTVDDLSPGKYLIQYGCILGNTTGAGKTDWVSVSINGAAATDADGMFYFNGPGAAFGSAFLFRPLIKDLTASTNSVQMKYRSGDGTNAQYNTRHLIVIRVANP